MASNERENDLLLREGKKIAEALGKMLSPFCEVVLHDLTRPEHAVIAIENNISGRNVGDSVTQLGLARLKDPGFAEVVQNYPNHFPDGRPAKSTSIGLKNTKGQFIGALCLNMDISMISAMQEKLARFASTDTEEPPIPETLRAQSEKDLQETMASFASQRGLPAKRLSHREKRELVLQLAEQGFLSLRKAVPIIAASLGISRTTVYTYAK
jgi:predicted transcriptional regulator YheO